VLLLVGLVFVLLRLRSLWRDTHVNWDSVAWIPFGGAFFAVSTAVVGGAMTWTWILRALGVQPPRRSVGIYLQSQAAKYVPGGVWQYAGRIALARAENLPAKLVTLSLGIELAAAVLAASCLSLLAAGRWGSVVGVAIVGAIGGLTAFSAPRRKVWLYVRRRLGSLRVADAIRSFALGWAAYVAITGLLGVAFWFVADALIGVPVAEIPFYLGAFAVAWLAGLAVVFAPSGLGVREAVLVALLRGRLGTADALIVAVSSRALLTVVDLVGATVGTFLQHRLRSAVALAPSLRETSDRDLQSRDSG
jgi:uncharacterized membrane protein YbhN (UPF0104 family)